MYRDRQLVFVYGTLRRGEENHQLLAGGRLLGIMVTDNIFTMIDLGDYPAVLQHGVSAIVGEVYDISTDILTSIDILEECPDYYQRIRIETPFGRAWIYVLTRIPDIAASVIEGGDWVVHTAGRGHQLE